MKALRYLCCALAALALVTSTGCRGSRKPRVAFVSNNAESFWNIAEAGAKKAAQENPDIELIFEKPPASDVGEQKKRIEQVLAQGVKGIAISVINPKNQHNYLSAIGKKTKLLTVDNDAPECGRLCYIGTDNYEAGRAAGALVKKAMPDGGTVVIFVGSLDALNAQQRRQGVLDELAGVKDVKIKNEIRLGDSEYTYYKTYTDQPDGQPLARRNVVQALKDLNKVKNVCLVGLWAYNPPAIYSAVRTEGKLGKVQIVGFDEDPTTLKAVKDGHIYGTIVQQPFEFGYRSIKILAALATGETPDIPKDGVIHVPHLAVTSDGKSITTRDGKKTEGRTAEAFEKYLKKLLESDE